MDLRPLSRESGMQREATISSVSSVTTSNSASTLSTAPTTITQVDDTDSTNSGKDRLQEEAQGDDVTDVTSLSQSSTLDGEVPNAVKPDDVLNHLLDGAKYAVDVDELVQSAQESFQQIETWYQAKPSE